MLYAAYYFFFKTKMYGVFQTCFYFGQMLVTCVAIGIVCGTMGYIGARFPSFFFFPFFLSFSCWSRVWRSTVVPWGTWAPGLDVFFFLFSRVWFRV